MNKLRRKQRRPSAQGAKRSVVHADLSAQGAKRSVVHADLSAQGAKRSVVRANLSAQGAKRSVVHANLSAQGAKRSVVRAKQRGVTLIEMLVVVVIMGLFVSLVGVTLFRRADEAKRTAAKAQIDSFMTALGAYKLDTGNFPNTDQGLNALRVKPDGVDQWAGPYLPKDVPTDPWGHQYQYAYPGAHGDEPDLISYGADGQPGGDGNNADIESWSNAK